MSRKSSVSARHLVAAAALGVAVAVSALAAPAERAASSAQQAQPMLPLKDFMTLLDVLSKPSNAALARIDAQWQDGYATMLLEAWGFMPDSFVRRDALQLVSKKSGVPSTDLNVLYEWAWSVRPTQHPQYAAFKAALYESVDPSFREYFDNQPKTAIRLDEIRWGGVHRDGIPPLDKPKMIAAADASWLGENDIVFGVAIDGDVRAYPKRILAWHEMFKDTIAGRQLNGVYCTLCGSMILYDTTIDGVHHELGTSGFLYRSNKLMYDHATKSLWSTLTGTPVVGPLVGRGIELKPLYVVTTTWKAWRERHPRTLVLSLDTGHLRDYREGAAYREYFASDRLMFNVPHLDDRLPNKAEVLALRFADQAGKGPGESLAIAADFLLRNKVHHERLGGQRFVVLTDASGANRVYASGVLRFADWDGKAQARDGDGGVWVVEEGRLLGPGGKQLERLPAHRAFWFGWYAAYPDTRLVK
ncbi:MAG: DUF3179 domain-containing protein [Rubrivivax sp.]